MSEAHIFRFQSRRTATSYALTFGNQLAHAHCCMLKQNNWTKVLFSSIPMPSIVDHRRGLQIRCNHPWDNAVAMYARYRKYLRSLTGIH